MSGGPIRLVDRVVDLDAATVLTPAGSVELTERERQLLRYLFERPGQRVGWDEIHREVWRHAAAVRSRAAYHAWRRLLPKLEADPAAPTQFVSRHGGVTFHPIPADAGPPTAVLGRASELARLADAVRDHAVVTLWGPPGVGKSCLARAYADRSGRAVVRACDLGALVGPGEADAESREAALCRAVGQALGVPLTEPDPRAQLARAIAGHGPILVVLDNLEGAAALASSILSSWVAEAPDARFLVTSRVVLGAPFERVISVSPLDQAAAVELFLARARAAGGSVADADRDLVGAIARALDGLPLAIELCAPWTRTLPVARLLERIQERYPLLARASSGGATPGAEPGERHASLWAALEQSWQLLGTHAREALARLSVFEGAFDDRAAETIIAADSEPPAALDRLRTLVDHSLLRRSEGGTLRMLGVVRTFARGRVPADEMPALERRHLEWFADRGDDDAIASAFGPGGVDVLGGLRRDYDDITRAVRRGLASGQVVPAARGCLAVALIAAIDGPFQEGIDLCRSVLAALDEPNAPPERARLWGQVSSAEGRLLAGAGDYTGALEAYARAVDVHRRAGDVRRLGQSLANLANITFSRFGDLERSRSLCTEALELLEGGGHRRAEAMALASSWRIEVQAGQRSGAGPTMDRCLTLFRQVGDRMGEGVALTNLAIACTLGGDHAGAHTHGLAALAIHRAFGNRRGEGRVLANLAENAAEAGHHDRVYPLLTDALRIHREIGARRDEGLAMRLLGEHHDRAGDPAAARSALDAALRIARACGVAEDLCYGLAALGAHHLAAGDLGRAREHLIAAVAACDLPSRRRAVALGNLGRIEVVHGDVAQAGRYLDQADQMCAGLGDPIGGALMACTRAEIALAAGEPSLAAALLARVRATVGSPPPETPMARAFDRVEGMLTGRGRVRQF